jgi:hypothetical protein
VNIHRVRPGYYETNLGHAIERFDALGGNPATWVVRYPGETTGDVSKPTLREAIAYLREFPEA